MREQSARPAASFAAPLAVPLAMVLALAFTVPCQAAPDTRSDDEAAAVDLLTRAMRVAKDTAYRGVQKVRAWSGGKETTQTLDISHVPGQGTYVRAMQDGKAVANPQPDGGTTGPKLKLLTDNYRVLRAGVAKVAGRWAAIVDARAAEQVMARYWLDRGTGLMLRRDVFDSTGELARRSWFTSISVDTGGDVQARAAEAPAKRSGERSGNRGRVIPLSEVGELREAGWTVPSTVHDGYRLYDIRKTGKRGKALHLSYSDGISAVSVFEQRGHVDESKVTGWHHATVGGRTVYVRDTVPRQLMWAGPGTVFTVVADAPDEAVASTVRALPGAAEQPGFLGRILRGLGRIVSWCNPF